jgi:DNA-binding XRE family transcriptional regulator
VIQRRVSAGKASGEAVSHKTYAQLHQRLQELIARGTKVADAGAGTPAAEIHEWISGAQYCLALLEDKIPTALADFRRIRESVEFQVREGEEAFSSKSAYNPETTNPYTGEAERADVLLDFRFDYLGQINQIMRFAATKIEIGGLALSAAHPDDESLGKRLRDARKRAGQTQEEAAIAIVCDHKDISDWERGKRNPRPSSTKKILDYIEKHSPTE